MGAAYQADSLALLERGAAGDRPLGLSLAHGSSLTHEAEPLLLRNGGSKPLRLRGELLAEGSTRGISAESWHEVALYRTESGQVAIALRFMRSGAAESNVHRARIFEDMDQTASWLETFDPAVDLNADFDVSDTRLSAARIALKAAALRDRAERLDRAYRCLVGEVLFRLEAAQ
jgi:hypothetical protein